MSSGGSCDNVEATNGSYRSNAFGSPSIPGAARRELRCGSNEPLPPEAPPAQLSDDVRCLRAERRRELNRLSKMRCRKRRGEHAQILQTEFSRLTAEYNFLQRENQQLRREYSDSLNERRQGQAMQATACLTTMLPPGLPDPNEITSAARALQVSRSMQQHRFSNSTLAGGTGNWNSMQDSVLYDGWVAQALRRQQDQNQLLSVQDAQRCLDLDSPYRSSAQQANIGTLPHIPTNPLFYSSTLLPPPFTAQLDRQHNAELAFLAHAGTTSTPSRPSAHDEFFLHPPAITASLQRQSRDSIASSSGAQHLLEDELRNHDETVQSENAFFDTDSSAISEQSDDCAQRHCNNVDLEQKRRAK